LPGSIFYAENNGGVLFPRVDRNERNGWRKKNEEDGTVRPVDRIREIYVDGNCVKAIGAKSFRSFFEKFVDFRTNYWKRIVGHVCRRRVSCNFPDQFFRSVFTYSPGGRVRRYVRRANVSIIYTRSRPNTTHLIWFRARLTVGFAQFDVTLDQQVHDVREFERLKQRVSITFVVTARQHVTRLSFV